VGESIHRLLRITLVRVVVVAAIAPVCGCDVRLPESKVYPTNPDISAKLALDYERSEKGDVAPIEDLVLGKGRVAQATRQMVFHFKATTQDGTLIAEGDAQVLIPPLSLLGFPGGALHGDYDPGSLPRWVAGSIMGMQVGGTRQITFNPSPPTVQVEASPSQRRRQVAPHVSPNTNAIVDGRNHRVALSLPLDEPLYLDTTLESVCRPHFTVWQFPTLFDRGTERVLRVGSCS
jgi:hypothetical protein